MIENDPLRPLEIDRKLRAKTRLLGTQGLLATAVALIEIASWDALAKSVDLPLATLLGNAPRAFPVYKTLVAMDPGKAAELAQQAVADGYGGVKIKLGHPDVQRDMRLFKAVREAVGADLPIMSDLNQALSAAAAMQRVHALDDLGLAWIEEPTSARDFEGHARIAAAARTPIQLGENWTSLAEANDSLRLQASDYVMPDVIKIGGVAAWVRAAALAETWGVPISAHSFPEISSHLMPAAATAHWLEHVGMADAVFQNPPKPSKGVMVASDRPGLGIEWNEAVVADALVA